jgi:hypothetical protein
MESMRAHFERESEQEGPWTSYNVSLGRPLLDSRKFVQGEKAASDKASGDEPASPPSAGSAPEPASDSAPTLDLFTEQKA